MFGIIPRKRAARSPDALGAGWIVLGIVFLLLTMVIDAQVQSVLTSLGRVPQVRQAASWWQGLGATSGIIGFLILILCLARDVAVPSLIGLAATGGVAQLIKHTAGRVRPDSAADATIFHGPLGLFGPGLHVHSDSFPSGHTAAAFAMAYALSQRWPKAAPCWYILAAGVGLSRTLRHVHFASDVIFGAILGIVICQGVFRWTGRKKLAQTAQET